VTIRGAYRGFFIVARAILPNQNRSRTMQITPSYIDPPKPGKTNWSIKDSAGNYYSCKPEMVGSFNVGQSCEAMTSSKEFNGKNITFIDSVVGVGSAPQAPQASAAPADATPANIFIQGTAQALIRQGWGPSKAYQWAGENYLHFKSRRFVLMTDEVGAPPQQEMVDPPVLDDQIPF
jgi:hypothetical protein